MTSFTPYPKNTRIEDKDFNARVIHRDKVCLIGLRRKDGSCSYGVDCHHIQTRGSGGDDTMNNGITLCRYHHNLAHDGTVSVQELRDTLNYYYGLDTE